MPSEVPSDKRRVESVFRLSPDRVESAFSAQELQYWNQPARFKVVDLDAVVITSGAVVATDPQFGRMAPLERRVPVGAYPVSLALVHLSSGDERIAFARMLLSSSPIVSWQTAWREAIPVPATRDSPGQVEFRQHAFYYSEAGAGCFMDAAAIPAIRRWEHETYIDHVSDGFASHYRRTWSWFSFKPDSARPENIVCCQSEPGGRASYLGLDGDGNIAAILIDFAMFEESRAPQ